MGRHLQRTESDAGTENSCRETSEIADSYRLQGRPGNRVLPKGCFRGSNDGHLPANPRFTAKAVLHFRLTFGEPKVQREAAVVLQMALHFGQGTPESRCSEGVDEVMRKSRSAYIILRSFLPTVQTPDATPSCSWCSVSRLLPTYLRSLRSFESTMRRALVPNARLNIYLHVWAS